MFSCIETCNAAVLVRSPLEQRLLTSVGFTCLNKTNLQILCQLLLTEDKHILYDNRVSVNSPHYWSPPFTLLSYYNFLFYSPLHFSSSCQSDSETAAILSTVQERWLLRYCSPGNNSCHLWGHSSGTVKKILTQLSASLLTYMSSN